MAAKKTQSGRRTTIYRLTGLDELRDAIRPKYLEDERFRHESVEVGERAGFLITGAMTKDRVEWCSPLAALTGSAVAIDSKTPAGALVLASKDNGEGSDDEASTVDDEETDDGAEDGVAYALTYGMGFQLLEPSRLDNLFGQRIAIRTAAPDKLRSLTVTTMDDRSRTSRATIPQGDGLLGFGVGDVGEAVSRIVANANLPALSQSSGEPLQLRGADALNVPIGLSARDVLADLAEIERILATEPPEQLKILEQLSAVKNPEMKERLDQQLSEVLDSEEGKVGLAWPHERVDENGTPDSWKPTSLWPGRRNTVRQGQPEWPDILSALTEETAGQRLARVDRAKIQLFRDAKGEDAISQAIPLRRWLAFECELDGHAYALYDGSWYQIHHDYAENINERTEAIFDQNVDDLDFPRWEPDEDEEAYNKKLANVRGGVCLDRKLIRTDLHPRGFEACDVYLPDGTLVHVKKTEKSAAASHLLAQALVSTDALCNDKQARDELRAEIVARGGDAGELGMRPTRVVLAMHRTEGRHVTADELFTFTKVNLVRQATSLKERGVDVRIVAVEGPEQAD